MRPDDLLARIAALPEPMDIAAHLRQRSRARLAAAILNVGTPELDQCVREMNQGNDEAATAMADLILDAMAEVVR